MSQCPLNTITRSIFLAYKPASFFFFFLFNHNSMIQLFPQNHTHRYPFFFSFFLAHYTKPPPPPGGPIEEMDIILYVYKLFFKIH